METEMKNEFVMVMMLQAWAYLHVVEGHLHIKVIKVQETLIKWTSRKKNKDNKIKTSTKITM